tara:strand:- start:15574 stop:16089 length:516 start_codon:yes stop_codon:yes gene_type:complete
MPLEELEKLVLQASNDINMALDQQGIDLGMGPPGAPPPGLAGGQGAAPDLSMVTPQLVEAASSVLVTLGIIPEVQTEMSPGFAQLLQLVADTVNPGIYNLQNEDDLVEFLNGIATGTIALPDLSGGATPGGVPGSVPGIAPAEAVGGPPVAAPGGVPGTTPAAGPGIIPGT